MMRLLSGLFFVLLLLLVFGCGEKAPENGQSNVQTTTTTQKVEVKNEVVPPEEKPKYKYEITGRRDPFEPLLVVSQQPVAVPGSEPPTPLQSYDLEQLRLIAIIIGKGPSSAMVMAPDGKGYILKNGIKVGKNNGLVVGIRPDAVLVEEQLIDFSGELKKRTQEIQLPKREGA